MPERLIVAVGGPPGSGLTTLARHLASEHDFEIVEADDCIADEAIQMGLKWNTFAEYDSLFKRVQRARSFSWLATCAIEAAGDRIVLAGLSTRRDARRIQLAGGATIVLVCPPDICLDRVAPTKLTSPLTVGEYDMRLKAELSNTDRQGLQGSRAAAWSQYEIDTSGTLDAAYQAMDAIIAEMSDQMLPDMRIH
jgi:shikimate kinase